MSLWVSYSNKLFRLYDFLAYIDSTDRQMFMFHQAIHGHPYEIEIDIKVVQKQTHNEKANSLVWTEALVYDIRMQIEMTL